MIIDILENLFLTSGLLGKFLINRSSSVKVMRRAPILPDYFATLKLHGADED